MKKEYFVLLLFTIISANSYAQIKDASVNLKMQASKMGASFVSGDYKSFSSYTYPVILKLMGGATNMAAVLAKSTIDMKAQGMIVNNISFDEPSKVIKSGKELQATIAQHTEIRLKQGGRLVSTSTLIAVSTNNGINWTFIDTSNKNITTLRKALPNLSAAITIPAQQPPLRYNY